jgi:hypothetical protein
MSTPHPAPYAVLRVDRRKAKAMAAISASSAHTMREKPTPNVDPEGPAPVVMHLADGKTPYQAARHLLEGAARRNRDTVLCREIVLSASPSHFRPGREHIGGAFEPDKAKTWAMASLAWARRQFPDQLASAVLHLDEMTPHMHLLVVPRVKSAAGVWKLNSKALFDRERLRDLQTSYGEAMAPLGIRRGEPGSQAAHSEVRQFYGALNASKAPVRSKKPSAPIAPKPVEGAPAALIEAIAKAAGFETESQRALSGYQMALKKWRTEMRSVQERDNSAWQTLKAKAAVAALTRIRKSHAATPVNSQQNILGQRPVRAPNRHP